MKHSKLLLVLVLFVPGCLLAQQQIIQQHWPAQLAAPRADDSMQLELLFEQQRLLLQLQPNQQLLARLASDQRSRLRQQGARYFSGYVEGDTQSWLRLSWLNGAWEGIVHSAGETWLLDRRAVLQPLLLQTQRSDSVQVIYRAADLQFLQPIDEAGVRVPGTQHQHHASMSGEDILNQLRQVLAGDFSLMPFTAVADTEFIATHGSNSTAVIVSRMNLVDGIYSNQVGVGIQLQTVELLDSNDIITPTNPLDLLAAFGTYMTTGNGSGIEHPGLAHLMTGKNIDGSVIGIAYLGVLCSQNFGFGVNQNLDNGTTSMLVIAHEAGHNFGAPHDGDPDDACGNPNIFGIMNPAINGSQEFSTCSLDQMADDIASASCLVTLQEIVFVDDFEK